METGGNSLSQLSGAAMQQAEAKARRLKTWDEYTDAERIEALRGEVRSLTRVVLELRSAVYSLQRHEHGARGDVLVRPDYAEGNALGRYDPLR